MSNCYRKKKSCQKLVPLSWGRAVFSGFPNTTPPATWIPFTLPGNLPPTSVLISTNRNNGVVRGRVYHTSTGLQLGKVGDKPADWDITFASILTRINNVPANDVVIAVYLMLNGQFIPFTGGTISDADRATFVILGPFGTMIGQRNIKIADLPGGTTLSLAAVNVSSDTPVEVYEVQWSISVSQLGGVREKNYTKKSCK